MTNQVVIKPGIVEVDGVGLENFISAFEVRGGAEHPTEAVLYVAPSREIDIALPAETVYIVAPPEPADTFTQAAAFVRALDWKLVEQEALEQMQWDDNQSIVAQAVLAVAKVFEDAATQVRASAEVRGSADGGPSDGDEGSGDL